MEFPKTLSELWNLLDKILHYEIFELKQTPITLLSILMFVLVILVFYFASRFLTRGLLRRFIARFHIDTGVQFTLVRISHYLVMIIGAVVAFQFVGIDLSGLAVIFGLLSVGVGFGLQNVTSNFVAGLILLFERPIKVGDRVTVGSKEGDVIAINMRSTTIRSLNNISIIVPNSEFISASVTNWTHGDTKVRLDIEVGVSYGSDLETVTQALHEAAEGHTEVLKTPPVEILLMGFGDSAWNMELRAWIANPYHYYGVRSEINCAIVEKFRAYGVEIPFPQRDLHVRSPLPLPFRTGTDAMNS